MRRVFRWIFVIIVTIPTNLVFHWIFNEVGLYIGIIPTLWFWYWVSTKIFKLSRDEQLRLAETSSETELRRAQERRDPAFIVAERERLEKMLASMSDAERQALLKKQKEYEEQQKI